MMLLRRLAPVGTRLASLPLRRRSRSCMLSILGGSGARLQQPSSAALGIRWCSSMSPENPATPKKAGEEDVVDLPQSGESQRRLYPETAKAYTIKVEGMSEERGRRLTETDVLSLFGNFEPYNINITYNPPAPPRPALPEKQAGPKKANEGDGKKKKGKAGLPPPPPYVSPATVTFQVPSFLYAKELVESFDRTDESWGERITVTREAEMFPVFISGLPVDMDVTAESLKQQFNDLTSEPPPYKVEIPGQDPNQKKVPLMEGVHLDLYPYGGYAVIRCLEEIVSLALVQGTLGIKPKDEVKKGKAEVQGKRAVLPDLPDDEVEDDEDDESLMFDEDSSGESGEEGDEQGPELTGEDVQALLERTKQLPILYNHPAWKGFAVRVNGLPAETTPEDIEMWFAGNMPYDIDVLPPEPGRETCSAYLRFAKKEGAEGCVLTMNGAELGKDQRIEVRGAFQKLFPIVMRVEPGADSGALEQVLQAREDIKPLEVEVVKGKDEGLTYVLRFTEPQAARDALAALQAVESLQHAQLGWKPFTLELANLPWDIDEKRLQQMIYMGEPYELLMQTTMKKGRRASVSFWTKEEAEKAVMCVKASGYTDIVFRKSWVTYHLKLKNLPMDTTEEELMEVLALHPPYQIDFPLSRRGRRKGQAVLRFQTYDGMLAAIHKLHGRDSPYDEVDNLERFETAGGSAELVVETHGEEKKKKKKEKPENGKKEGLDAMIRGALEDEEVRKLAMELTEGLPGELRERERGGDKEEDLTEEELWIAEQQEREEADEQVEQMFEKEDEVQVEDDGSGGMLYNPFEFYPEGPWSHFLVDTDTTQKIIKGGHVLSYRALIVTGNGRGCAGWGVGKGATAEEAKVRALHDAKKNLQYVDLYLGRCITTPLYGRHNNCRVVIQAGSANKHHKEGRYVNDMLRLFGVDSGEGRSIGRRNPYSLVRAVFHAMSKHEGVEEIARKRGRRLINVSKARNMGL